MTSSNVQSPLFGDSSKNLSSSKFKIEKVEIKTLKFKHNLNKYLKKINILITVLGYKLLGRDLVQWVSTDPNSVFRKCISCNTCTSRRMLTKGLLGSSKNYKNKKLIKINDELVRIIERYFVLHEFCCGMKILKTVIFVRGSSDSSQLFCSAINYNTRHVCYNNDEYFCFFHLHTPNICIEHIFDVQCDHVLCSFDLCYDVRCWAFLNKINFYVLKLNILENLKYGDKPLSINLCFFNYDWS